MASHTITRAAGLHTAANQISGVPEGAQARLDNCVIPSKDVIESRRGQDGLGYTFGASADRANEGVFYNGTLFVNDGINKLYRDTGSAFTVVMANGVAEFVATPADATLMRLKTAEAGSNLYIATDGGGISNMGGVQVLRTTTGTAVDAGVPRATEFDYGRSQVTGDPDAAGSWLPKNSSVAYKVVWGIIDANGVELIGAPSGRTVVINPNDITVTAANLTKTGGVATAVSTTHSLPVATNGIVMAMDIEPNDANFPDGNKTITVTGTTSFTFPETAGAFTAANNAVFTSKTKAVLLRFDIPLVDSAGPITTSYFYRVYRTDAVTGATVDPGEEFFAVAEGKPSAGDLTNGYVQYTDKTPEVALGEALYTNPNTGGGAGDANDRPPIAHDLTLWGGRLWGLNTHEHQRLEVRLLGVGSPDGMQTGDSITVFGETFTAGTDFTLTTALQPSQNIEATARALAYAISSRAASIVDAFYISGDTRVLGNAAGRIVLQRRAVTTTNTAFSVYASRPASWVPVLTTGASGAVTSTDAGSRNGLFFSKLGQFDAVPLLNRTTVGAKTEIGLRIQPLGDRLFAFTDQTIHTVSGQYPFRVDLHDNTAKLLAPDSVAVVNNKIYCLTNQGVVAVSDGGVELVGLPVEVDIKRQFGALLSATKRYSFGFGYESERLYGLWLPTSSSDTYPQEGWVYNVLSRTWAKWPVPRRWGRVNPSNDTLYMGHTAGNKVLKERKAYTNMDMADEAFSVTILAHGSPSNRTVLLSVADHALVAVGDVIEQSDGRRSVITDIAPAGYDAGTVAVADLVTWSQAAATIYPAIDCHVEYVPITAGHPAMDKQFREACLHFDELGLYNGKLYTSTEKSTSEKYNEFQRKGWGQEPWGQFQFGEPAGPKNVRRTLPNDKQQGAFLKLRLNIREAQCRWRLNGVTLEYEGMSERNTR